MDISVTYRVIKNRKPHTIVHKINVTSRDIWSDMFISGMETSKVQKTQVKTQLRLAVVVYG